MFRTIIHRKKTSTTPERWTPDSGMGDAILRTLDVDSSKSFLKSRLRPKKKFPVFKCKSQAVLNLKYRKVQELTIYVPDLPQFILPPVRKEPFFGKKVRKKIVVSADYGNPMFRTKTRGPSHGKNEMFIQEKLVPRRVKYARIDKILQLKKD
jgi:hypothetical protein